MKEYRRLTYNDRLKLEALYNSGMPVLKIAEELGFFYTGIYREIKCNKLIIISDLKRLRTSGSSKI